MNAAELAIRMTRSLTWGGIPRLDEVLAALRLPPGSVGAGVAAPGTAGAAALVARLAAEDLHLYPVADAPAEPPFLPIVPDESESDPLPSAPLPWPFPPPPPAFRRRRLDSLHDACSAIALLVLDAGARLPAILRGAAGVLAQCRPVLLLGLAEIPAAERPALWQSCAALLGADYAWRDGFLMPFAGEDSARIVLEIVGHATVLAIPCAGSPLLPPLAMGEAGLAQLARAAQASAVAPSRTRRDGSTVPPAQLAALQGLHPSEGDPAYGWRWTGPDMLVRARLVSPGPGSWHLHLGIHNWGHARAAEALQVFANGQPLALLRASDTAAEFGPYTEAPDAPGAILLELLTPPTRPASPEDRRLVGLCLGALSFTPAAA